MQNYKQQFKGKKITVMGLGLLGRGIGYTKFLAEYGADLIVTDLKTAEQLKTSVEEIKNYELKIKNKNKIKFVLGEHRLEDFRNRDMIIKAGGVPLDSIYIKEAKKNKIPIEMDVSLFIKSAPKIKVIGVTGTRGKSMTTALIYHTLKDNISSSALASARRRKINVYLGGNIRGVSTLPLLKKIKENDILVCELDSWQLQGFGEDKFSPHISIFTSFMADHMNYYKDDMDKYFEDKANIYKYQNKDDILIIRPGMRKFIGKKDVKGKLIIVNPKDVSSWKFNVLGDHQRENMACAVEVAKQLGIPLVKIKKAIAEFKGLEGRMQLLRVYKGIKIYNDNNATTPEATIAGLKAISDIVKSDFTISGSPTSRNIVLICGGADKNLPLDNLTKAINLNCKFVSFLPGSGTDKFLSSQKLKVESYKGGDLKAKSTKSGSHGTSREVLREVIKIALSNAKKGDTVLFSPAFASFGMFNNEYERNDLFIKIIKGLR
jgi:UDP-N-acetylmuramoylalanine--D-glutamate ligase